MFYFFIFISLITYLPLFSEEKEEDYKNGKVQADKTSKDESEGDKYTPGKEITKVDEGFWIYNSDREKLRIGGMVQIDGWLFLNGDRELTDEENDLLGPKTQFLIRRARLYATGSINDLYGFMIMPRWDRLIATLQYAWIETLKPEYARVRVGLFKEPFGLEAQYSDAFWDFMERSLGTHNYIHIDDIGLMVYGYVEPLELTYGIGIFNGRGRLFENNSDKEYVGRVVWAPFYFTSCFWKRLYLGVSASIGNQDEDLSELGFTTVFQNFFWIWEGSRDCPVTVDTTKIRYGADFEWLYGPASLRAECLFVDWGDLFFKEEHRRFTGSSFYVEGGYILTGEEKPRNTFLIPYCPLDFECGWGAWEIVGRYEMFYASRNMITAGFATGANVVHGPTIGINCYINANMVFRFNWEYLKFNRAILLGHHLYRRESALMARVQAIF